MPSPSIQYAANFLFANEKQFELSINYYKKGKTYPVSYLISMASRERILNQGWNSTVELLFNLTIIKSTKQFLIYVF